VHPIMLDSSDRLGASETEEPVGVGRILLDDADSLGRMVGWDLNFRQLSSGRSEIPARILVGKSVNIVGLHFNHAYHQRGHAPDQMLTFGIPLGGTLDWFRRPIEWGSILNFNHASGFDAVSAEGFSALTLSIDRSAVYRTSDTLKLPLPDFLLEPGPGSVIRPSDRAASLRRMLSRVLRSPGHNPEQHLETDIVTGLLNAALATTPCEDKSSAPLRARSVAAALDCIEANRCDAISVTDICRHTGAAWRTLDRGFRERFGIGPKAYVIRRRLSGVRAELIADNGRQRVSDIANAWDFWHMGQFAHDYRKLFGELPSETLVSRPKSSLHFSGARSAVALGGRAQD